MKRLSLILLIALFAACTSKTKTEIQMPYSNADFEGSINGKPTRLFTMENKNGMVVTLTNYGAKIVSIYAPDRDGNFADVMLGFNSIEDYKNYGASHGAVVGPYANRIANASFVIDGETYPCNAVALDTVMLCRFSFPKIAVLATTLPGLQRHLFRLLSRDIGRAALLAGDWSADQRMAAFLIGLSRRLAARGFSADRFQLTMARTDIANYLRLAPETVSRVLRRFQKDGLLLVDRREVELLERENLAALADPILHR